MVRYILFGVVVLALAWPAAAQAQEEAAAAEGQATAADEEQAAEDDDRARLHFEAGTSYFEQARYQDAVDEWAEAYRLSQRPLLLLNLANAHERLAQYEEAATSLEQFLATGGEEAETNRSSLETRIGNLRRMAEERAAEAAAAQAAAQPTDTPPEPVVEEEEGRAWYATWWFWTIVGVVVAGTAVGIAVPLATADPEHDWRVDMP